MAGPGDADTFVDNECTVNQIEAPSTTELHPLPARVATVEMGRGELVHFYDSLEIMPKNLPSYFKLTNNEWLVSVLSQRAFNSINLHDYCAAENKTKNNADS